jgi:hypothetical protein
MGEGEKAVSGHSVSAAHEKLFGPLAGRGSVAAVCAEHRGGQHSCGQLCSRTRFIADGAQEHAYTDCQR